MMQPRNWTRHEHAYPSKDQLEIFFRQNASYSYILQQTGADPEKLRGIYPNTHIYSVMRETLETGP